MGWNPFKSAAKKVGSAFKTAGSAIASTAKKVGNFITDNPVGQTIFNVATGNIPGLLNQTVDAIGGAIGGGAYKNSTFAKFLSSTLTGNIPRMIKTGYDAGQKLSSILKDTGPEPTSSNVSKNQGNNDENKATVDNISEEVSNQVQDADNTANLNQGDTQAEAAFKADLNVANNQDQIATGVRNAVANLDAQSQADYLKKLGYANQLELMADNLKKGKNLQIINGIMSGMSDVRLKDIENMTPLIESIEAVKEQTLDYSDPEIIIQMASVDPIDYTYKEGVADNDQHIGVSAQSLYNVPIFKNCIVDDGQALQVDIIKASKVLYEIVLPAVERYLGEDVISLNDVNEIDPNEEIDMNSLWKLLESNLNLAANICKQMMHAPDVLSGPTQEALMQGDVANA